MKNIKKLSNKNFKYQKYDTLGRNSNKDRILKSSPSPNKSNSTIKYGIYTFKNLFFQKPKSPFFEKD